MRARTESGWGLPPRQTSPFTAASSGNVSVNRKNARCDSGTSTFYSHIRHADMELIRLENITKTYRLGELDVPVLKGISLSVRRGEMVAIMGASGSGKTTLMNVLGCLDRPSSGQYWLDGQEMSCLTPNERAIVRTVKLGFVFQNFNLLPRTTAAQNVVMPLDYAAQSTASHDRRQLARTLLQRVGLRERCEHEPSQMSGGQQQRVAVARALVNRPALLLADEPTGNLDSSTSVEILEMFQKLNSEGITVVLVTHDPKVAAYAHRTIHVADGLIYERQSVESLDHQKNSLSSQAYCGTTRVSRPSADNGNGHLPITVARTDSRRRRAEDPGTASSTALASMTVTHGTKSRPSRARATTVQVHPLQHAAESRPRRAQRPARS